MPRWQLTLVAAALWPPWPPASARSPPRRSPRASSGGPPATTSRPCPQPEFLPQQRPGFELPPAPPPRQPGLASGKSLLVKDIVIEGNTVLPPADLGRHRRTL